MALSVGAIASSAVKAKQGWSSVGISRIGQVVTHVEKQGLAQMSGECRKIDRIAIEPFHDDYGI